MKKRVFGFIVIVGIATSLMAGGRFIRDDVKEVVIDNETHLMWQDNGDVRALTTTWQDAIDFCENFTLGGYTDWHLPNINELESIVDKSRVSPSIDPTFQQTKNLFFWSSTTYAYYTPNVRVVDFMSGNLNRSNKIWTSKIRCVRDNN